MGFGEGLMNLCRTLSRCQPETTEGIMTPWDGVESAGSHATKPSNAGPFCALTNRPGYPFFVWYNPATWPSVGVVRLVKRGLVCRVGDALARKIT